MKIISTFLIIILLTGCLNKDIVEEQVKTSNNVSSIITPYNIYVTDEKSSLSKYEPTEKIYLGVYLEYVNMEKQTIENFEEIINGNHSIYSYEYTMGDEIPLKFILACYSKNKIPFINVTPAKDSEDIFNLENLKKMAKSLGKLNIPIFINLYENPNDYNEDEYIKFFKQAKIYLEMYAKNVALVWSINWKNVYELNKYYPGDNYVDWVGLNIYENISEENKIQKVFPELEYFYNKFQNIKPICINLGISHFSNETLDYLIEEKIAELNRYLDTIPKKYPNIKLINYLNYSNFEKDNVKNNFSITDNKKIINTYKNLTESDIFAKNISLDEENYENEDLKKLNFLVYKQKDDFLININNINLLMYNKKIVNFNEDNFNIIEINNTKYYNLNQISNYYKFEIEIDENNKMLILK